MQTRIRDFSTPPTIWGTVETACLEKLSNDSKLTALVAEKWPLCANLKDWVYQRQGPSTPSIVDMYITVQLSAGMEGGLVACIGANLGHTPSPDKEGAENQRKLDDLPHPFYAEFDRDTQCGPLDCDGLFGWSEPVSARAAGGEIMVPPMAIALEVGYMPAGKMLYAINQERGPGLARWSYGHESIVAFVPMNVIRRQINARR